MKDLVNYHQYRFFVGALQHCFPQKVRVHGQRFKISVKFKRRIRVNQVDGVRVRRIVGREIQAFDVFYDRAAAKGMKKFVLERPLKAFMCGFASRKIYFDPGSF
jgi:hypothetical protein